MTALGSGDILSFGVAHSLGAEEHSWFWDRSQLWGLETLMVLGSQFWGLGTLMVLGSLTALGSGTTCGFRVTALGSGSNGIWEHSRLWDRSQLWGLGTLMVLGSLMALGSGDADSFGVRDHSLF